MATPPKSAKPKLKVHDGEIVIGARGEKYRRKLRRPAHGKGLLQVGNPGPRPSKWAAFCRWLTEHPDVLQQLERAILKDPLADRTLLMFLAEQGHGRARQQLEVRRDEAGPVPIEMLRRELAERIALHLPPGAPPQ